MTGRQVVEYIENLSPIIVEKPEKFQPQLVNIQNLSPIIVENQGDNLFCWEHGKFIPTFVEKSMV